MNEPTVEPANSDSDQIDEDVLNPLRKKCVDFNSSIDVKSETSDTFSNYSTGVEDVAFAKTVCHQVLPASFLESSKSF